MRNQNKEEIYTLILENIKNINRAPLVTRVMYESLNSNRQLKEYLAQMIENDLLKYDGHKRVYEVTRKGKQFLLLTRHLNNLLCPDECDTAG
jgi:predicted transcriptional regulator